MFKKIWNYVWPQPARRVCINKESDIWIVPFLKEDNVYDLLYNSIVGWSGIVDEEGNTIKYNNENKSKLINYAPEFRDFVLGYIEKEKKDE